MNQYIKENTSVNGLAIALKQGLEMWTVEDIVIEIIHHDDQIGIMKKGMDDSPVINLKNYYEDYIKEEKDFTTILKIVAKELDCKLDPIILNN